LRSTTLRGEKRRRRRGRALRCDVGPHLQDDLDRADHLPIPVDAAGRYHKSRVILEDPVTGSLTYKRLLVGIAVLGRSSASSPAVANMAAGLLPNANGVVLTLFCPRPRPGTTG
jgi:acyl-[acyl-carrier-protein]-phospholipid O-acyltransferase/long-chain-fatty-acid--[acyl-carrier-protein] ligase